MTEDELIEKAIQDFGAGPLATYESIGQPGKFLASLEAYYMNGMADAEAGNVDADTGHFYRVERWIVRTDTQGFHTIEAYDTVAEAISDFLKREEEYCKWAGDDE